MTSRILVGITTYNRPEMLDNLLGTLALDLRTGDCEILVVDNAVDRSGYPAVLAARAAGLRVMYEVESRPGVVHGRNRVLGAASEYDAVIFLDDDEHVEPGWFEALRTTHELNPLAVVTGPVEFRLPEGVAAWVLKGGFFERANWPDGHLLSATGTGNSLIPTSALRCLGRPLFDPDFGRTGGEDTEFFERLRRLDVPIVWSRGARVVEAVPIERTTWRAVTGRCVRSGNVRGRLTLRDRPRAYVLAGGAGRVVVGGARWSARVLTFRRIRERDIGTFFAGIGHIQAALGKVVEVYGEE